MKLKFFYPNGKGKREVETGADDAVQKAECPPCNDSASVPASTEEKSRSSLRPVTMEVKHNQSADALSRLGPKRPYIWACPTACVLFLAFYLPVISVWCDGEKLARVSISGMLEAGHVQEFISLVSVAEPAGLEADGDSEPRANLLPGFLLIVISMCAAAVTGISLSSSSSRAAAQKFGLWYSAVGLCAAFGFGAYCGVYLESVIQEAAGTGNNMDQAFAATMMSSRQIALQMESAYYLTLAMFSFAIACFLVDKLWHSPAKNDQIRDTIVGIGLVAMVAIFVVMAVTTLVKPAQFSNIGEAWEETRVNNRTF